MNPVLVFNCHYNGLSIIRELGRRGIKEIYALDSSRSLGTYSKYTKYIQCPNPLVDEEGFITFLINLDLPGNEKPVLFPTHDHWACAIARNKKRLEFKYLMWVAPAEVVDLLLLKQDFHNWAIKKKYPVPKSWRATDSEIVPNDVFPIVAKPEYRSISSNNTNEQQSLNRKNRSRLTILKDRTELINFVNTSKDFLDEFLLQEYVRGLSDRMYTVGIYANQNSEVMGVFTGRKVRGFPPDSGDCILGQVESVPSDIINLVKEICLELGYTGIAEFEFKKDSVTKEFFLIEINPRSWSWIGITPACGVSLPWMAYCDITELKPIHYQETDCEDGSIKFVRLHDDRRNCLFRNRRVGFPEWHMNKKQWKESLNCEILVRAGASPDDRIPGVIGWFYHTLFWRAYLRLRNFLFR